jgi:high-affinity Fe2+/Pb2+ permease
MNNKNPRVRKSLSSKATAELNIKLKTYPWYGYIFGVVLAVSYGILFHSLIVGVSMGIIFGFLLSIAFTEYAIKTVAKEELPIPIKSET